MSAKYYEENHFLRGDRKPTITDYVLASHYPYLLMVLAENKQSMSFKDFLKWARASFPEVEKIQKAIPVSTGRRFEFIRIFTKSQGLPDFSVWVVSAKGTHGDAFLEDFDPVKERENSSKIDWRIHFGTGVKNPSKVFSDYLKVLMQSIPDEKKVLISEKKARGMMQETFIKNRDRFEVPKGQDAAKYLGQFRGLIIADIMNHVEPEEAFKRHIPSF